MRSQYISCVVYGPFPEGSDNLTGPELFCFIQDGVLKIIQLTCKLQKQNGLIRVLEPALLILKF